MSYVLAYDVGTTGVKTCLFGIDREITLLASAQAGYGLYLLEGGGAEQDPEEWWSAMCRTTRAVFAGCAAAPEEVAALSFCSQMQGLVLVDGRGAPVRRAMSYMDQRAAAELKRGLAHGPQVAGANVVKLLRCLRATGAVPSSVKDPVWKYKWVQAHEPEVFARADKWLDVKEYLLLRCTGQAVMTEDSAYATLLFDTRKGREGWSGELCALFDVKRNHLPPVIRSTDRVGGGLTEGAAAELGLGPGTPVFGGGGDASLIGVGAGASAVGSTHIYCGTSGWVSTVTDRQLVDVSAMIAAIVGAQRGRYNYFAEMETAGKCLEWVRDHLALDEIGIYLEKRNVAESPEAVYASLYDYLTETVEGCPPGAGGVIFTPWLHGNRCPFEDPAAAGMFFGEDGDDPGGAGGDLLPPAVDAGVPGEKGAHLSGHPLRGRRGPVPGDRADSRRRHRPDRGGGGQPPERGGRGRGGCDGRGTGDHPQPGRGGRVPPGGADVPAQRCQPCGLRPELRRLPAAPRRQQGPLPPAQRRQVMERSR